VGELLRGRASSDGDDLRAVVAVKSRLAAVHELVGNGVERPATRAIDKIHDAAVLNPLVVVVVACSETGGRRYC